MKKKITYSLSLLFLLCFTACGVASGSDTGDELRRYRPLRGADEVFGEEVAVPETTTAPLRVMSSSNPSTRRESAMFATAPATMQPSPSELIGGRRVIEATRPMVALTFDDGPSSHTAKILDLLDEYGGRATFFVIAPLVERHPELIARMASSGHEILGHTVTHRSLTSLSRSEVRKEIVDAHAVIETALGTSVPQIFRPPFGNVNSTVREVAGEVGFSIVNWDLDTRDWSSRNAITIHGVVEGNVRDRSIVLAHDIHAPTAESMELVIPMLVDMGFQLVTVSELMHYSGKEMSAGGLYTHGR